MDNQDSTPQIINREDAIAQGLKRYFTGNPCKHGHLAERHTANGTCIPCEKDARNRWKKKNPGRSREFSKAFRDRNPGKYAAQAKAWRLNNREKLRTLAAKWAKENLESRAAIKRNRRARIRNAEGTHTAQDISELYAAQKGRCAYCKVKVGDKYHVDHIQPLFNGGGNGKDNLQICCPTCNLRKNAKDPIDFAQSLGLLI